ncbi:hypothetical protein H634G_11162 [Metarhizium anisopliae BRIP 53293]|uniref:Uncharacterized protein n=1 Tax=Metarhizium anisopliae BRIP 53293 TaxID=1291518 RepID=A0A0D9NI52_METAN|nr:hypothetical protein H634G_11162 [Metarhizium anisopliae BRIP 53293]KJK84985.1 hypothetical protein H633G_11188 [Metarhizium anisopliae BRIP 53284]
MRGLIYTGTYFPKKWFDNTAIDEDEKYFEPASTVSERCERILWLGYSMAMKKRRLHWDEDARQFFDHKNNDDNQSMRDEVTVKDIKSDNTQSHLIVCHQDEFLVAHICSECEDKISECTQYASFGSEDWRQNENYVNYAESTLEHCDTMESVLPQSNACEAIADPSQAQWKAPKPVHTTESDDLLLRLREEGQS